MGMKKSTTRDLEDVLSQRFNEARATNIPMTGAIQKEKLVNMNLETEGFHKHLMGRWKKKHDLCQEEFVENQTCLLYTSRCV